MNPIKCTECNQFFTMKKNLYVHLRKLHNQEPCESKEKSFKCDTCEKMFASKYTLERHFRNYHQSKTEHTYSTGSKNVSRLRCPEDNCGDVLSDYKTLRNHLLETHSLNTPLQEMEFSSLKGKEKIFCWYNGIFAICNMCFWNIYNFFLDFEKWKDQIQQQNKSFYTLDTAVKLLSDGVQKKYYNCNRSLSYKPKGNQLRALKSTGSCKIGRACPSRMEVSLIGHLSEVQKVARGSVVQVKFWPSHYGHSFELGHMVLSKNTRAAIASRYIFCYFYATLAKSSKQQKFLTKDIVLQINDL